MSPLPSSVSDSDSVLLESDDPKFFVIVGVLLIEGLGGLRSVQVVSSSNELDGWSSDKLPPALIEETGCLRNVASGERMQLAHTQSRHNVVNFVW